MQEAVTSAKPSPFGERFVFLGEGVLVAVLYLVAGLVGFRLTVGDLALFWPPAGVALAGLYLFGQRQAPFVWLAAAFLNLFDDNSLAVTALIATGQTLGAMLSVWLLRRADFRVRLDRLRDVGLLVLYGGVLGPLVAATIATAAVASVGELPTASALQALVSIWLGEGLGALIVAPLLLAFGGVRGRMGWPALWPLEGAALAVVTVLLAGVAFSERLPDPLWPVAVLLPFPPLLWGAFRFGLHGTSLVSVLIGVVAAWSTAAGSGVFASTDLAGQHFTWWTFAAAVGSIGLVMWALVAGHQGSLEHFKAVFERSSDALIMFNEDVLLDCNPAAVDLFAAAQKSALVGMPFLDLAPPKQADGVPSPLALLHHMREADRHGMGRFEWLHQRPDGEAFHAEIAISPVMAEGRPGYLGVVRDISEQKAQQEALTDDLRRTTFVKERMESELNVGRSIQMSMLPLEFPPFPDRDEFTVFATLQPAREVGGDFYDFFLLDENSFCFLVGDVSGKGVPAALFMAVTKTLLKSEAMHSFNPGGILTRVNDELAHDNESAMFVTLWLGILDVRTGQLRYTNAGHNPPYVKKADGALVRLADRHGPVLGAVEGMAYDEGTLHVQGGDTVLLYTDGVTEAMNPAGELYQEERLEALLADEVRSVESVVEATASDVWAFQAEAEQADDVTLLAVRYEGARSASLVLELRVPNDLTTIDEVNAQFDEFAAAHGIDDRVRRSMKLVFDELLNNIISYAFEDNDAHEVKIRIVLAEEDHLTVSISDDGKPFNPFGRPEPDLASSIEERAIGGLGVHLVENVMDEVSYAWVGDRNVVTLVKYIEGGGTGDEKDA